MPENFGVCRLAVLVLLWIPPPGLIQGQENEEPWLSTPGHIQVLEGTSATFAWRFSRPDPVILLYKYKPPSLESTTEILECNRTASHQVLIRGTHESRVEYVDSEGSGTIRLKHVNLHDAGHYHLWVMDPTDANHDGLADFRIIDNSMLSVVKGSDFEIKIQTGDESHQINGSESTVYLRPRYCNTSTIQETVTVTVATKAPQPLAIHISSLQENYPPCMHNRSCSRNVTIQPTSDLVIVLKFAVQNMETITITKRCMSTEVADAGLGEDQTQSIGGEKATGEWKRILAGVIPLLGLVVGIVLYILYKRGYTWKRKQKLKKYASAERMNEHRDNDLSVADYAFSFKWSELDLSGSNEGNRKLLGCLDALLNTSGGVIAIQIDSPGKERKIESKLEGFITNNHPDISSESFSMFISFHSTKKRGKRETCYLTVKKLFPPILDEEHMTGADETTPLSREVCWLTTSGSVKKSKISGLQEQIQEEKQGPSRADHPRRSLSRLEGTAEIFSWTDTTNWQNDSKMRTNSKMEIPPGFEPFPPGDRIQSIPALDVLKNVLEQKRSDDQMTGSTIHENFLKYLDHVNGATWLVAMPSFARSFGHEDTIKASPNLFVDVILFNSQHGLSVISIYPHEPDSSEKRYTLEIARIVKRHLLFVSGVATLHVGAYVFHPRTDEPESLEDTSLLTAHTDSVSTEDGRVSLQVGLTEMLLQSKSYARNVLAERILHHSTTDEQTETLKYLKSSVPVVLIGVPSAGKTWTALRSVEELSKKNGYQRHENIRVLITNTYQKIRDETFYEVFQVNFDSLDQFIAATSEKNCVVIDIDLGGTQRFELDWENFFRKLYSVQKEEHTILCMDMYEMDRDLLSKADAIIEAFKSHCNKNLRVECRIIRMSGIQRTCSKIASFKKSIAETNRKRKVLKEKIKKSVAPDGDDVMLHLMHYDYTPQAIAKHLTSLVEHLLSTANWDWLIYAESDIAVVIDVDSTGNRNYIAEISTAFRMRQMLNVYTVENFSSSNVTATAVILVVVDNESEDKCRILQDNPMDMNAIASRTVRRLDIVYVGSRGQEVLKELHFNDRVE